MADSLDFQNTEVSLTEENNGIYKLQVIDGEAIFTKLRDGLDKNWSDLKAKTSEQWNELKKAPGYQMNNLSYFANSKWKGLKDATSQQWSKLTSSKTQKDFTSNFTERIQYGIKNGEKIFWGKDSKMQLSFDDIDKGNIDDLLNKNEDNIKSNIDNFLRAIKTNKCSLFFSKTFYCNISETTKTSLDLLFQQDEIIENIKKILESLKNVKENKLNDPKSKILTNQNSLTPSNKILLLYFIIISQDSFKGGRTKKNKKRMYV